MNKNRDIIIDSNRYEVELIGCNRRTISLKMISSCVLVVRFPAYMGYKKALEYVHTKSSWISKKHELMITKESVGAGQGIYEGRVLYYEGRGLKIVIGGNEIRIEGNILFVPLECSQANIEEWYKAESIKAVNRFIEINGSNIPDCSIKVKKQKTIWGSCNSKRRVYINSRISMCPQDVVEYVLWHEISHLFHMNHSRDFYRRLGEYIPNYKKSMTWLKNHNHLLHI